jgi:outer membrane receptor protein involved in Fe transport
MSNQLLRTAICRVLHSRGTPAAAGMMPVLAIAALGFSVAPAFAQDAPQDQSSQKLETITVTGSNIRRVDIETSNPVVTIDRAAIEKTGKLTLGDIVQDLPAVTGGNINPQVNNGGGTGGSSIGLRGLGSQRTLVLINGQRITNNDPNSIPANMIERIEVLTDGASSVYGSDAIAGVVNFILRSAYQGAEFTTNYGISDHDDGVRKGYQFTFGQSSDRGSIMAGIDYNKIEGVLDSHREFSQNAVSITGSAATPPYSYVGGSSFPAYGRIQLPPALAAQYGCGIVALNKGASGQNVNTDYHCFQNAGANSDKYNFAAVNLLMTPQERSSLFLNGTYKLTDNVSAYLIAYHNKTSASFQIAPALFGPIYGGTISAQSYYNPFGVDFTPSGLDYRLRLVSAGNRAAASAITTDQVMTGLKGNFSVLSQDWNWDAGFNYGRASQVIITKGLPNVPQINLDTGPSFLNPTTGQVECGTVANPIATGCTPLNIFNQFLPASAATIAGTAIPAISSNFNTRKTEHLDMNGGLFDLPTGSVQLAVGGLHTDVYTHSYIDPLLTIDPATGNCALGSQCSSPLQGGYNIKEVYAEAFIPVLKDLPFVKSLNVTIGDRYSKYSTFGSTNNTKFALEFRPIEDLLLRGTVSQVFRAPAVGDVFGSPSSSAPLLGSDPCDHYTGSPVNPACVNVPTNGTFVNQDVLAGQQIKAVTSGSKYANFPLGPESGKSFDFGVIYDPHWLNGLSIGADIFRVYLNNTIEAVGAQTVLNLCSAGQLTYCPLITRFASGPNQGEIAQLLEPTGNLGRTDVKGVDFNSRYNLPEFAFGRFNITMNATYTTQFKQQTAPGTPANGVYNDAGHLLPFGSAGNGACPGSSGVCLFPRWRAQSALNYNLGPFDASWRIRYIGRFTLGSPDLSQSSNYVPGIPGTFQAYGATAYNDISFGYNIEPINSRVEVGVDNLTNKQPPLLYANHTVNDNTDPADFDLIGRYYWGRFTVKF